MSRSETEYRVKVTVEGKPSPARIREAFEILRKSEESKSVKPTA